MRKSRTILAGALAALSVAAMVAVLWKPAEEKPANPVAKPAATKPVPTGAVGNTAASNPTEKMTGNAGGDKPAVGGLRFEEVAQKAGAGFSHARAQFDPKAKPLMPWLTAGQITCFATTEMAPSPM